MYLSSWHLVSMGSAFILMIQMESHQNKENTYSGARARGLKAIEDQN